MHRRGSIFLFIVAVMGVIFALAMGMLASSQMARTGGFETGPDLLAEQAAREGLNHAIGLIRAEFEDPASAGVPSQFTDAWRSHFWAIDTHRTGHETPSRGDDEPRGLELNPYDVYENDVHVENLLTDPYCHRGDSQGGAYAYRERAYSRGSFTHPGTARWYEPGVRSADPVLRPLSFHLEHPVAPTPGSLDPARRAGENYRPAVFAPVRYDAQLRAVADPADLSEVRYRLRYAVVVAPLDGQILNALVGGYDPTAASAAVGATPAAVDLRKISEVDATRADTYAPALSEMVSRRGRFASNAELAFRGLGYQPDGEAHDLWSDRSLSRIDVTAGNAVPYAHADYDRSLTSTPAGEPNLRIESEEFVDNAEGSHQLVGPVPSFEAFAHPDDEFHGAHVERVFLYTPFGRAPQDSVAPGSWDSARCATPWRYNVPVAAPQALMSALFAYLPQELKTQYNWIVEGYRWTHNRWSRDSSLDLRLAIGDPYSRHLIPHRDLFTEMASTAAFDRRGGLSPGAPYPGTDPDNPGPYWRADLGAGVTVNHEFRRCKTSLVENDNWFYCIDLFGDVLVELDEANGVKRIGKRRGEGNQMVADQAYYYHESYWADIATAYIHTIGLTQYAWADHVNDTYVDIPTWPASLAGYFSPTDAPGFAPGGPCRNHAVGGRTVPSALDTVAELDAQFLRNLGETPLGFPTGSRPSEVVAGIEVSNGDYLNRVDLRPLTTTGKPVSQLRKDGDVSGDEAGLMELIVNDFRMSFFGASPQYPDFRPLDLDDDGTVRCSAYTAGFAAVDGATGFGPPVDTYFSLTGYLMFQKSRYYRIFVRGELFDELRQVPVAQSNLECVYVVDPDGDVWDLDDQPTGITGGTGMADSHVLFQRPLDNQYRGLRSHAAR